MNFKVTVRDFSQEDIDYLKKVKLKKSMTLTFKSFTSSKNILELTICADLPHKPEAGSNLFDGAAWLKDAIARHTQSGIAKHHRACNSYRIIEERNAVYMVKEHAVSGKQKKIAGYILQQENN